MTNKKIKRNTNKVLNLYDDGGWGKKSSLALSNAFKGDNLGGTLGAISGAAGSMLGSALSNAQLADTSGVENQIKEKQTYKVGANSNEALMNEWGAYSPMNNVSWRDVRGGSTGQRIGNTIGAAGSGAAAGASVGGPIGAIVGGVVGLGSSIGGWISGDSKAKKKARNLNNQINAANARNLAGLQDKAGYIDIQNDLNLMSNYYGEGGNLNANISNIGQHGGNFSNGVVIINNGGTHEENPNDGIMIGKDTKGIPNMVEEGEVVFGDYIFSNRLSPTKKALKSLNLPENYTQYSFAKLAEKHSKESEERPNDPISKNGLKASLTSLRDLQEFEKAMKENKNKNKNLNNKNLFAFGGDNDNQIKLANNPFYKFDDFLEKNKFAEMFGVLPQFDFSNIDFNSNKEDATVQNTDSKKSNSFNSLLRAAPIIGSGIGVLTDLAGITNKPDYSNAEMIERSANNIQKISPTRLSSYLSYKPLDRNYLLNKLQAQAGASRRAIENQSGGNRAAAMAGLLASDYNTQAQLGDLFRNAEEYNQNLKMKVMDYNRQTDMFNTEAGLKADSINTNIDELRLKAIMQSAGIRANTDAIASAGKSANLSNFLENLGELGTEKVRLKSINDNPTMIYSRDEEGNILYKKAEEDKIKQEKAAREKARQERSKKNKDKLLTQ